MSQIIWLNQLPPTTPILEPNFSGLLYRACADERYTVLAHRQGDVDSLYLKALLATHQVDQSNLVKIFWQGRVWGELRGQC